MALTASQWIAKLQKYPPDTLVRFVGECIMFDRPDAPPSQPEHPDIPLTCPECTRQGYHETTCVAGDLSAREV